MVLLLIILLSLIIFALRATLYGLVAARIVHKAGKVTVKAGTKVAKSTKEAAKKAAGVTEKPKSKSGIRKGAESALKATAKTGKTIIYGGTKIIVSSYEFTLALVIRLLRWLRGLLIALFGLITILDLVVFLILILASAFYIMYLSDGTYSTSNVSQVESQEKEKETEKNSSGEVTTDNMKKNPYWGSAEKTWKRTYANSKKLADQVLKRWEKDYGNKITSKRKWIIQRALDCYGRVNRYSQNSDRIHKWSEYPDPTDCSGFVTWVYSGLDKSNQESWGGYTGSMKTGGKWKQISASDLLPGDIAFWQPWSVTAGGSADHTGIFLGKDKNGKRVFVHCTSATSGDSYPKPGGVAVSYYDDFGTFGRYVKW